MSWWFKDTYIEDQYIVDSTKLFNQFIGGEEN